MTADVLVFPQHRRIGRVREVAQRMLAKPTERAATHYRDKVTDSLLRAFDLAGVSEPDQDEQLGAFWQAVQSEMIRLSYGGYETGELA